ncbi:DNA internalization-related competence protein ComEC/Rec2 [Lentibacillus amyloliquefaciens]|uniref:Competence protein n=1 Tax=Lentibacillus amyloliquefaciens TaxID=1472767 RepID=A0A0U3NN00_9BACI|nr:DNA internalization-related competence protein ComEC/Rec2 [Lentibacillus amyloliquefaciens]ALX48139.1 competence protein [Lentibacillus amyloliquefaciens]
MKGYWHFPALGVTASFLAVIFASKWFIIVFSFWILYLYFKQRLRAIVILASLTFSISAYMYIPELEKPSDDASFTSTESAFAGEISSPVTETASRIAFEFSVEASDERFMIVHFKADNDGEHNLKYGAVCTVSGKPELPDSARNPGQFDYQDYLLSQGMTHQIIIDSLEKIDCTGSSPMNHIYQLRSDLLEYVQQNVSSETSAWVNALILGDDTEMDDSVTELFQRWNLTHLMAISGLHVGLVVGLLYFLLVKLNILTKEKAQWVIIFFLPLYAVLAGGEPSVMRASMMVLLFMIAGKLNWKFSVTDVISIVFLLLILTNPLIIYHIGFQLSFCVTLGLLLSKNWFAKTNISFFTVLNISFVSQMMILPLQVEYFFTFQPLSILVNLIIVPYFSLFVIPCMFLILLLAPVAGPMAAFTDQFFLIVHEFVITALEFIDQTLFLPWVIGSFPLAGAALYYGLFLIMMKKLELEEMRQAFKYGCFLTALIILSVLRPYFSPIGYVTALDVGQGDAIVIELPYRKGVILVDAGAEMNFDEFEPSDKVYKQIIRPYLYSRGISQIDAVFISHDDTDHMGSLLYLIEDMPIKNVFVSTYYTFTQPLAQGLTDNGTTVVRTDPDDAITVGGQMFHILSPAEDYGGSNENSLVLHTEIGGKKWLLTGDIGTRTEKAILKTVPGLTADVLKVAHHGSNTSTDAMFLEKIQPEYGIISAGKNNRYGHPHSDVIQSLDEAGAAILRTDESGAVQYVFKGTEGTFITYLP